MRDDQPMRVALRWWDTLRPAERVVAMSLAAGGLIVTVNSAIWAVAACYIVHERAHVALTREESWRLSASDEDAPRELSGGTR